MSSSPESASESAPASPVSPSAGHESADEAPNDYRSESDLSEFNETAAVPLRDSASPPQSPAAHESSEDAEAEPDLNDHIESSEDEAQASDDADYDIEESPAPSQSDANRESRSTSQDSRRAPKRKAVVEEDDYIRENPELYGLRRSVRWLTSTQFLPANVYP